mmetsp:Transcript_40611/g.91607  ORF Transcript_40611/g.91607 Transcript_40611/m.91607 type:complete len:213 (-) Transcript_40611:241-879(-)
MGIFPAHLHPAPLPDAPAQREVVLSHLYHVLGLDCRLLLLPRVVGGDSRGRHPYANDPHGFHVARSGHVHTRCGVLRRRRAGRGGRHGRLLLDRLQYLRHSRWPADPLDREDRLHRGRLLPGHHQVSIPDLLRHPPALHGLLRCHLHPRLGVEAQQTVGAVHGGTLRTLPCHRSHRGGNTARRTEVLAWQLRMQMSEVRASQLHGTATRCVA